VSTKKKGHLESRKKLSGLRHKTETHNRVTTLGWEVTRSYSYFQNRQQPFCTIHTSCTSYLIKNRGWVFVVVKKHHGGGLCSQEKHRGGSQCNACAWLLRLLCVLGYYGYCVCLVGGGDMCRFYNARAAKSTAKKQSKSPRPPKAPIARGS